MHLFPFPAIVGQEDIKEAIILNMINPSIGGVLIDGACGTAKSTLARGASLLTQMPFWELPVNCSEDRLIGSIDIEKTIKQGKAELERGILHHANGGILFVDDIYLLPEYIADTLQNIMSTKEIHVERDGISSRSSSRFLLIATMNSQLGRIRSSLSDQIGLYAKTTNDEDSEDILQILRRRQAFDDNPTLFDEQWKKYTDEIIHIIQEAKLLLPDVSMPGEVLQSIAKKAKDACVEGHRADLVMYQTVRAVAAFHGRAEPNEDDISEAAYFALPHRAKAPAPPEQKQEEEQEEAEQDEQPEEQDPPENNDSDSQQEKRPSESDTPQEHNHAQNNRFHSIPKAFAVGEAFQVVPFGHKKDRMLRNGWGRRTQTKTNSLGGRYIYPTIQRNNDDFALDATIRAAAPYQAMRPKDGVAISIHTEDIREKVRQRKVSNLLVFVVDASGSMGVMERMVEAKGAVLSLLKDAYVKRDKIAMVTFRGEEAQVVLPPTRSAERGYRLLQDVQTGGKTPLNAGITKALTVIQSQLRQQPQIMPMMIVITDGKGNVSVDSTKKPMSELLEIGERVSKISQIDTMVIDIERSGFMQFGIAKKLADAMGGTYCKLDQIKSQAITDFVNKNRGRIK